MARTTQTITILKCDYCGTEGEDVENRRFDLDGKRRQLEACGKCWDSVTKAIVIAGRQVRSGRPRKDQS